jgi:hypothetical protein
MDQGWPYPGSRWWKMDFHTHTPSSLDTIAWQKAKGTTEEITPETWLQTYMSAKIDIVAVTDHNTGEWIDILKNTYESLKSKNSSSFRELHIFPGVEISVHGGFHLLAIFGSDTASRNIYSLLDAVNYRGTQGGTDGATELSAAEVIKEILKRGGIPIPAHVDSSNKGLLRTQGENSQKAVLDPHTLRQVFGMEGILAAEQLDTSSIMPEVFEQVKPAWARVIGSDSHSFQGADKPGSRFTWVKMATPPSIEGLRLALLDGNGVSLRCSNGGSFDPFVIPECFIESIEVDNAQYMGRNKPQTLSFSPYYNALIGGRGTGKSTIVHLLRLGYQREQELQRFSEKNSPRADFEAFNQIVQNRNDTGALRPETSVSIIMHRQGIRHKINWKLTDSVAGGSVARVQEQSENGWKPSLSQHINPDRFPLRILSQGQIAAMAGDNRQALLDIIDGAAKTTDMKSLLYEHIRTYAALQSRLRELDGRLGGKSELERKKLDAERKLKAFSQSAYTEILESHQQAVRQTDEVESLVHHLSDYSKNLDAYIDTLIIDDWPTEYFDVERDAGIMQWKNLAESITGNFIASLRSAAESYLKSLEQLLQEPSYLNWSKQVKETGNIYEALKSELAERGVNDPADFGDLVTQNKQLDSLLQQFKTWQEDRNHLEVQLKEEEDTILNTRMNITRTRQNFLEKTLMDNPFVRIELIPFGYDCRIIEQQLRELIDVTDVRFERDILEYDGTEPVRGLVKDLVQELTKGSLKGALEGSSEGSSERLDCGDERLEALHKVRSALLLDNPVIGKNFHNYLQKKMEKQPEFADRIRIWYPEDDVVIHYRRGKDFVPIEQGSKGQRAAALLAFLLAFGDEPIVLDQPEDDLDNHLIYNLIVAQIRDNKLRRQLIIVTHNPNIVVNGDSEMVHTLDFSGQCYVKTKGTLQEASVRREVCEIMEGGREAFEKRWSRLGRE